MVSCTDLVARNWHDTDTVQDEASDDDGWEQSDEDKEKVIDLEDTVIVVYAIFDLWMVE